MKQQATITDGATKEIGIDVGLHWRCMKCDHRQPMETPDGNEEWKFHCDDAMRLQPTWQLYGVKA